MCDVSCDFWRLKFLTVNEMPVYHKFRNYEAFCPSFAPGLKIEPSIFLKLLKSSIYMFAATGDVTCNLRLGGVGVGEFLKVPYDELPDLLLLPSQSVV